MKRSLIIFVLSLICSIFHASVAKADENKINISLIYHRLTVNPAERDSYTITTEEFENDIKYLLKEDYTFCTATEFDSFIRNKDTSGHYVSITFDDGYISDYLYVLPILEKYKVNATFFIVGCFLGRDGYITQEQLKILSNSPYTEIGNHTYSLHSLSSSMLHTVYVRQPNKAIADYKKNIEFLKALTGTDIKSTAYPYGEFGYYVNSILNNSGIITFSSKESPVLKSSYPYPRINRPYNLSVENIIKHHSKNTPDFYSINSITKKTYNNNIQANIYNSIISY